jgi:hypothetical protein
MTIRLPDLPASANAEMRRWWADVKRLIEIEMDRQSRQQLLPIYPSTALPDKSGKPQWIAVSTASATVTGTVTSTVTRLVPAYRDGTNWRHWGTGTATF